MKWAIRSIFTIYRQLCEMGRTFNIYYNRARECSDKFRQSIVEILTMDMVNPKRDSLATESKDITSLIEAI